MFFFHVQALYNTVTLFMSWFALGNYWLTFSVSHHDNVSLAQRT